MATRVILIISFCINCLPVIAVASETKEIQKSPVSFPLGGFELSPVLEIGESYDDNIFRRDVVKRGSFLTQIHAGIKIALERHFNRYSLTYVLRSLQFHDSPQDDYVDHYLGLDTHTEFTRRNRLDLNLNYLNSHYRRGYFLNRDLIGPTLPSNDPDQYHSYAINSRYRYGQANAKGNIELLANYTEYNFDNNPDQTERQNRQIFTITPGFFYRIANKTHLLFQMENYWAIYQQTQASKFDYHKQRYLFGGTWEHSTMTQASIRLGYLRLIYDNSSLSEYNDITWDIGIRWAPLIYSQINLNISRDIRPSLGSDNLRTSNRFSINWTHDWSTQLITQSYASFEQAQNRNVNREDNYFSVGFDINYSVLRWLGIGLKYSLRNLQSDDPTVEFTNNTVLFYISGNPRLSDNIKSPWSSWYY